MDTPSSAAAIAKRLASPNSSTRHRALRLLLTWLPQVSCTTTTISGEDSSNDAEESAGISDADLLKIWKGLFYCLWHADKLPAQEFLIERLCSVLENVEPLFADRYFSAAIATIRREWSGIDFLRLDKFYLFLRRLLRHKLKLLRRHSFETPLVTLFTTILLEKSLLSSESHQAQGVNYQLAEIFLDELRTCLPLRLETLEILLNPFILVMEKSPDKVLVNKIKSNVFDRLHDNGAKLLSLEKGGEKVEVGSDVEKFGRVGLLLGISKKFLEAASKPETVQGNRKVLFGLHDSFVKLEKDLEKSGVRISPMENGNLLPESTEMVEVEMNCGNEGCEDKPLKKRKKSKKVAPERTEEVEVEMCSDDDGVSGEKPSKKKNKRRSKKAANGVEKKGKIKKNRLLASARVSIVALPIDDIDSVASKENADGEKVDKENGVKDNGNGDGVDTQDSINFDETLISNLQKQFEKAAAEAGMQNGNHSLSDASETPVRNSLLKKRRRAKSLDRQAGLSLVDTSEGCAAGKSGEKSLKKVRFSMKSNLVWKPHSPLPPQNLRLPPSATPRGSALKKGVPAGPIKDTPLSVKKTKAKSSSLKKGKKSISPAAKRLRKLQSLSV